MRLEGHIEQVPFEQLPSYAYASLAVMADDLEAAPALYERAARLAGEHGDERRCRPSSSP